MGDAARPERRDGGPGFARDERQEAERAREKNWTQVLNGDTEGSSRSCRSSSRGYLIRVVSKRAVVFGVYVPGGPDCIPKSAALQQVEQQWTTSSVCSLTDMLVARLDL